MELHRKGEFAEVLSSVETNCQKHLAITQRLKVHFMDVEVPTIDVQQLKIRQEKKYEKSFVLLDVRTQEEHELVKLRNSKLIPLDQLDQSLKDLDKNDDIIVYCHHGMRSYNAAKFLLEKGFTSVSSLEGGIHAWSLEVDTSLTTY